MKIRVFIADDHGVLRGGLRALIAAQPDMEVVGDAADGVEAARAIPEIKPDVALLDISMPGPGGLGVIASIKGKCPETRILVLTVHEEPGYVRAAVAAGAAGYVVKKVVDTELLAAIRAVAQGRRFMDHSMDSRLTQGALRPARAKSGGTGAMTLLSERERQVLELVAGGFTNREVADELGLGVTTAIHGDKSQAARLEALDDFKAAKVQVMVATDVAARGLDIDDLPLVVNYELPYVPEDYIHRIGRTGRAGASGEAISFCAPEEEKLLTEIERLLKRSIPIANAEIAPARQETRSRHDGRPARATKVESRVERDAPPPRRQRDESVFDLNPDQPLAPRRPERAPSPALTSTNGTGNGASRRTQPIAALLMKRAPAEPEKV